MATAKKCAPSTRKYPRVQVQFTEPSMTKQIFADECNINKIMERFQKTGALTHYSKHACQYADITGVDYVDMLNQVADANTMFEELPSSIRDRFENDPAQFLDFVQDPKNSDEMIELGLKEPTTSSEAKAIINSEASEVQGDQTSEASEVQGDQTSEGSPE